MQKTPLKVFAFLSHYSDILGRVQKMAIWQNREKIHISHFCNCGHAVFEEKHFKLEEVPRSFVADIFKQKSLCSDKFTSEKFVFGLRL